MSAKAEAQSAITGGGTSQLSANPSLPIPPQSGVDMPGASPLTKEGLNRLDQINSQISSKPPLLKPNVPGGYGAMPPRLRSKGRLALDQISKCTRDDQVVGNVDEFMRDDLNLINKEEEKLQRELLKMN